MTPSFYFYGALILAAVGVFGVYRFLRNPPVAEPSLNRRRASTLEEAKEQWFISALNEGRVDFSNLQSIDEEIKLGDIRFKGKIKFKPSGKGVQGASSEAEGPIVYLRKAKRFGFQSEEDSEEEP